MVGRIARGASVVFAGRITGIATKGALVLVLTRYLLEPARYGLLFLAVSVLSVAMLFGNLGFAKAGAKYIAEYRTTDPDLVPVVVWRTVAFNCVTLVLVCVVLGVANEPIAALVAEPEIAGLLVVGTGYVVCNSLKATAVTFLQGFNLLHRAAAVGVIRDVALLVAVPAFLVFGFGLAGALVGYAVGYALAAGVGLAVISRRLDHDATVERDEKRAVSVRILRYSVPLTLTKGANTIDSRADTILLGVFRGPTAIGFYTLGKQLADFLIAPAQSLGFAISPTYGERKAADEKAGAARLYERSFVYTVAFYAPAAAGVVLVADPAVRLIFGADYAGASPVLQVFSVFVFVRAIDKITNDALDYLGRARARATAKGTLALANVGLNLVLIPPFGVIGAATATVATYSVLVAVELVVIVDELPIDAVRLGRAAAVGGGIALGMSAVVYPLSARISDIPSLTAVVGVGVLVWLGLTMLTDVMDVRQLASTLR